MESPPTYLAVRDEGFNQKVLEEASGLAHLQRWRKSSLDGQHMSLPRAEEGSPVLLALTSQVGPKHYNTEIFPETRAMGSQTPKLKKSS